MNNYIKMTIFIFAIIPFSIIYFLSLFGLYDLLNEFIEKLLLFVAIIGLVCLASIVILGLIYKIGTRLIDALTSRNYEFTTPTTQVEVQNIESRGATEQESSGSQEWSGGEFDMSKYKQGSTEAANAYKQSSEHKEAVQKIRTLDELIAVARQGVDG